MPEEPTAPSHCNHEPKGRVVPESRKPVVPEGRRPVVPEGRRPVVPEGRRPVVIDTSLFVNPEVRGNLGATPNDAIAAFVELAKSSPSLEFYMPPAIFEELMNFVDRDRLPGDVFVHLIQKPPARLNIQIPSMLLYEFVDEMRERVNRGLRASEKAIRGALNVGADESVKDLRRKYRDALREGILDSKEDVDLILLAYELDALLVTADQGACRWAEKLGVRWLVPSRFRDFIEASAAKKAPEGA